MTFFISHVHQDLRRSRLTKRGATARAEDVPQGLHKEYPRMERIMLPKPDPLLDHSLSQPFPGQPLLQVREKGYTGYYNYRMNTSCAIIKFEHNRRATTNIFSRCQITESCRIELEG